MNHHLVDDDMNLSSSDEDDDSSNDNSNAASSFSSHDEDITKFLRETPESESKSHPDDDEKKNDDSDDDSEDIDWEDADDYEIEADTDEESKQLNGGNHENRDHVKNQSPQEGTAIEWRKSTKAAKIDIDQSSLEQSMPSSTKSNKTTNSNNNSRRRKRQFRKLPGSSPYIQSLLLSIQRAHMLTLTSRAMYLSSNSWLTCSSVNLPSSSPSLSRTTEDDMNLIWYVAHSLIPIHILVENERERHSSSSTTTINNLPKSSNSQPATTRKKGKNKEGKIGKISNDETKHSFSPSIHLLQSFSTWFFEFINDVNERRRRIRRANVAAGAPSLRRRSRRTTRVTSSTTSTTAKPQKRGRGLTKTAQDSTDEDESGYGDNNIHVVNVQRLLHILAYLSPQNDEDQHFELNRYTISPLEKLIIFVFMTRSMGWRVRYISAIDPIEKHLTVDHPIFSSGMKNTLHSIYKANSDTPKQSKRKKRKRDSNASSLLQTSSLSSVQQLENNDIPSDFIDCAWAEVLTNVTLKLPETKCPTSKWVHIDPHCQLFNKPLGVEYTHRSSSQQKDHNSKAGKRKKTITPLSYVIAIEHSPCVPNSPSEAEGGGKTVGGKDESTTSMRITDVTARYTNKWSLTLKLRGATAKELAGLKGRCPNVWWGETITKINERFGTKNNVEESDKNMKSLKPQKKKSSFKVETKNTGEEVLVIDDSSSDDDSSKLAENMKHTSAKRSSSSHDQEDESEIVLEQEELLASRERESIPTSKNAFKNHHLFVIPSVLKKQEVLAPDSSRRICGIFKGEMVYKRGDVSLARTAKKWLYEGQKVKEDEISKPAKVVKARKKPIKKGFQMMESYVNDDRDTKEDKKEEDDGKSRLYGIWQTTKWSPPYVSPNEPIPVNEHNNVELALLNPGLVHLELHRIALVAKKLGINYAPCLIGFEGHGGNLTPTIRGIVVHEDNEELLRDSHTEFESQAVENEYKERQRKIYQRWKRLIVGITSMDQLERDYAKDCD